eukprot:CAMPEP_0197241178 /NCGR_PEP_ID=MMETSP1429-20130617/7286_1 /TAXON_ID=49237 /ORGANISM="Chaetoceros  sp., Strain UNC1202" /LENGTH=97 /DNA_ID=CAMNT_0042700977 /DNA_START=555 /DNA_END=848 /DNA_ORIENTATION=+
MARKTASLQKRMKKKKHNSREVTVAAMPKPAHATTTTTTTTTTTQRENLEHAVDVGVDGKGKADHYSPQQHTDGEPCNCYLRKGQMFLPPWLLEGYE